MSQGQTPTHTAPAGSVLVTDGVIDLGKLQDFIESQGYCNVSSNPYKQGAELERVHVKDNVLTPVDDSDLKNRISKAVRQEITPGQYSKFLRQGGTLKSVLEALPQKTIQTRLDTKDTVYLFFINGALKITAERWELLPYSSLTGCVWNNSIIQRDFNTVPLTLEGESLFETFLHDVYKQPEVMETTIGYLLSGYKDTATAKAVILTEKEAGIEGNNGRTGKGIICQFFKRYRLSSVGEVDGRSLKGDRFDFAGWEPGQSIFILQDLQKNYDFAGLYAKITDSFEVEKKNKDKFEVPFEESPKILITTNHYFRNIMDRSSRGRTQIIELENTFTDEFTPFMKYGKRLFEGWPPDEWDLLDRFVIRCIQAFLAKGLLKAQTSALFERKSIEETVNPTVKDFLEDWCVGKPLKGEAYVKKTVFEQYNRSRAALRPYSIKSQSRFFK